MLPACLCLPSAVLLPLICCCRVGCVRGGEVSTPACCYTSGPGCRCCVCCVCACVLRDLAWLRASGVSVPPRWCPRLPVVERRVCGARGPIHVVVHWASARRLAMHALGWPPSSRSCDPDALASHCLAGRSLRGAAVGWWGAVLVFYLVVSSERCVAPACSRPLLPPCCEWGGGWSVALSPHGRVAGALS